jgi:toxin CcdB
MTRYDVFANPFPRSRERQPLLVVLQSDLLAGLDTVVVAPLESAASGSHADRLNPPVVVDGESFVIVTQEAVAVRRAVLGAARGSLAGEHDKIVAALELLFIGF